MSTARTPGERVLVLMTNATDAGRTVKVLDAAGLEAVPCADVTHLCHELEAGAGTVLLSEEAIIADRKRCIHGALFAQPPWSSIPLVAVVRAGATAERRDSLLSDFAANVTLIERPVRMRTLVSVVRGAVRARQHQYEARDAIVERELALDAARQGWWRFDPATGIVTHDDRYAEIYGLTGRSQHVDQISPLLHPDDVSRVWAAVEAALNPENPQPYSIEYRVIRPDGTLCWVDARGLAAFDGEGPARRVTSFVGTVADVTDRRQAEEQLRRNHDTFFHLIQNNPFGIYVVDADFRLLQVSKGAQKIFSNVQPLLGRDFAEVLQTIWAEPFASEAIDRFRHTLATGEAYAAPTTTERRSDVAAVESYDWQIERIVLPDGRLGVVCYFYDLTELNRFEAALRASEERFRRAFEIETVGVIFFDAEGTITQANEAFLRMGGYDQEDIAAGRLRWDELTPPEWMPQFVRAFEELRTIGRTTPYEKEYYRKDGSRISALFAARRITEHEGVEFVLDITDRKRAEEALREKTERLNLLLENISDYAVIISDPQDIVLEWQGGAERITGYSAEEIIGQPVKTIFTPEDRAAGHPEHELRTAAETGRAENVRWHLCKDGSRFFAEGVTVALRDEAGRLRGFGKVFRDATVQKEADEALRDADRRKDQFLATLAHELRNPLAPISNALEAWPLIEHDRAQTEQMRGLIDRQVRQVIRLIDDLLDVSRVSRGKLELRKQRLDLAAVVEAALEGVRPFVESRHHELFLSLPDEPVALDGDPGRLMQVIGNLVHNAAKYTGRNGQIWLSAKLEGRKAVVSVRDDGPGIPHEMLSGIFEMFTQVDQTLDRAHGGLGIGLTLVKTLVELHGGTVEARSEGPGRGSEFIVRLPAEATPHLPAEARPTFTFHRSAPPPARRVLVVDDIRPSANTLALMLEGLGQETRSAYDGPTALALAEEFRPAVIFLDIAMPGMNGYEVARRIRAMNDFRPVLVALTGYGQEEDRRRAFEAGFNHHLVKPTSVAALHELLMGFAGVDKVETG